MQNECEVKIRANFTKNEDAVIPHLRSTCKSFTILIYMYTDHTFRIVNYFHREYNQCPSLLDALRSGKECLQTFFDRICIFSVRPP